MPKKEVALAVEFDLPEIDTRTRSEEGVWLKIKALDGVSPLLARNGEQVEIKVLGPDSKVFRKISRKLVRKRMQEASAGQDDDDIEGDTLEALVEITVDWKNVLARDGSAVDPDRDVVKGFYRVFPAIADQVDIFINRRQNFTMASSTDS